MDDKAWDLLLEDIKEIRADVKEVKGRMSSLEIKVATLGAIFGIIGSYIKTKLHL